MLTDINTPNQGRTLNGSDKKLHKVFIGPERCKKSQQDLQYQNHWPGLAKFDVDLSKKFKEKPCLKPEHSFDIIGIIGSNIIHLKCRYLILDTST